MSAIQWYPGHMAKARRAVEEQRKLVDFIIELRDARMPRSSGNPDFEVLFAGKKRLILCSKADLAEEEQNLAWERYWAANGVNATFLNALDAAQMRQFRKALLSQATDIREEYRQRRGMFRTVRILVAGVPNVGKSTLINSLAGGSRAKVENRPGVTRGNQWIRLSDAVELMDTPGLLWPKFDHEQTGLHLAYCGSIASSALDEYALSCRLIQELRALLPERLETRYGALPPSCADVPDGAELLAQICANRGWVLPGGEPDLERGARTVLAEFRNGRIGRITLERPASSDGVK